MDRLFKFEAVQEGGHVRVTVRAGAAGQRAHCGTLHLRSNEWDPEPQEAPSEAIAPEVWWQEFDTKDQAFVRVGRHREHRVPKWIGVTISDDGTTDAQAIAAIRSVFDRIDASEDTITELRAEVERLSASEAALRPEGLPESAVLVPWFDHPAWVVRGDTEPITGWERWWAKDPGPWEFGPWDTPGWTGAVVVRRRPLTEPEEPATEGVPLDLLAMAADALACSESWFPALHDRGHDQVRLHVGIGLAEEAGEVAGVIKKANICGGLMESCSLHADGKHSRQALADEWADVFTYLMILAAHEGIDPVTAWGDVCEDHGPADLASAAPAARDAALLARVRAEVEAWHENDDADDAATLFAIAALLRSDR